MPGRSTVEDTADRRVVDLRNGLTAAADQELGTVFAGCERAANEGIKGIDPVDQVRLQQEVQRAVHGRGRRSAAGLVQPVQYVICLHRLVALPDDLEDLPSYPGQPKPSLAAEAVRVRQCLGDAGLVVVIPVSEYRISCRIHGFGALPRYRYYITPMISSRCLLSLLVLIPAGLAASLGPIDLSLDGDFRQGGLVVARTEPGTVVDVRGEPVRVSPKGVFLIGIGRDEEGPVAISLAAEDGRNRQESFEVSAREYQVQRIDGLPAEKVTPPKDVLRRIRQEAAATREARSRDDPRTDFLGGFIWPLEGRITGVYGSQRILNGEPRTPHFGVDVAAPVGTAVVAPADAIVTLVHPDMYYSGGTLIMDHGHGLSSTFIHLSRILVEEGQRVRQGQVVAEVGATGRVTGPHLDWRMNLFDIRLDPAPIAGPMGDHVGR